MKFSLQDDRDYNQQITRKTDGVETCKKGYNDLREHHASVEAVLMENIIQIYSSGLKCKPLPVTI